MSKMLEDTNLAAELEASSVRSGQKLFDRIGGRPTLEAVHKRFYDKIFAHAWIGQFFQGIDQKHIESQQTDFIAMLFGGPKSYSGRMPVDAHEHIMIDEEIFALRTELLLESLTESGIGPAEIEDWLRIDGAFKKVLIKKSLSECKKRYFSDSILEVPNPNNNKRAS